MEGVLRLRITPSELESLSEGKTVSEFLADDNGWRVSLEIGAAAQFLIDGAAVRILIAKSDVSALAEPDREGIYFDADQQGGVKFFIEKDFACAHPRPANGFDPETDTFPSPPGFKSRHRPQ